VVLLIPAFSAYSVQRQREADASAARRMPAWPPVGLSIRMQSKRVAELRWEPSRLETVVAYRVYRKVGGGDFRPLQTVTVPRFLDKKSPPGDVEYAVTSIDSRAGESDLSKPARRRSAP
jgi:hypothetical protein